MIPLRSVQISEFSLTHSKFDFSLKAYSRASAQLRSATAGGIGSGAAQGGASAHGSANAAEAGGAGAAGGGVTDRAAAAAAAAAATGIACGYSSSSSPESLLTDMSRARLKRPPGMRNDAILSIAMVARHVCTYASISSSAT